MSGPGGSRARTAALALAALCAVSGARGEEPTQVTLEAGRSVNLCAAGLARCPVSTSLCDDPKVASVENGPDGAVLKGASPGTTLCSVTSDAGAFRRVLRVTVAKPER